MGWSLFPDHYKERADQARYERKVNRMRGPKVTARGAPKATGHQPYPCGRTCRPGHSCTSTVRGGVCPCRDC